MSKKDISKFESMHEHQKQKVQSHLETLLLEGLESGQPIEATQEYLNARQQALREKLKEENAK